MLVPLTRKKFEELIPLTATGDQYKYCWGQPADFLRRLIISIGGIVVAFILQSFLGEGFGWITLILGIMTGLYWFWGPIYLAWRRNREYRSYPYSGFFRGEVYDVFVSEELIGTEETVNKRGDLVIVENRERRLNLEVGDESGFVTKIQVPLKRDHRTIRTGDIAEMLVMSTRPDLSRIMQLSDVYMSDYNLWVSDYPVLRKDAFVEISRRLDDRS
jgi:hypothetical protein